GHTVRRKPCSGDERVDQLVDHLVQTTREPVHRHPPLTQRSRRLDSSLVAGVTVTGPTVLRVLVDCHTRTLRTPTDKNRTVRKATPRTYGRALARDSEST